MTAHVTPAPEYNGLTTVEKTLPSSFYYDRNHYERELKAIWYRNWNYLCRSDSLDGPLSFRTFEIGTQQILIVRDEEGVLRAFHNTCRHRGSTLCTQADGTLRSKLLTCPYHAWSYNLRGELVRTPTLAAPEGFDRADYPLYDIAVEEWRGFVFVNLAGKDAVPFEVAFERGSDRLNNWPLEDLVVGHTYEKTMECNWKVFWENFNECLHCPGVHPELCDIVPIYGRAIMTEKDDPHWPDHGDSDDPRLRGGLKQGAETWSMDGAAQGPGFPDLSDEERVRGQSYMTSMPSGFIVAHVDYVRTVRLRPLGPERTELVAQWLFPPAALADPSFDMAKVVDFATIVMDQDAYACELNQRGLRSERHEVGVLMAEEYYVHQFQDWVRECLGDGGS